MQKIELIENELESIGNCITDLEMKRALLRDLQSGISGTAQMIRYDQKSFLKLSLN